MPTRARALAALAVALAVAGCAGAGAGDDPGDGDPGDGLPAGSEEDGVIDWDLSGQPPIHIDDLGLEREGRYLVIRDPQHVRLQLPDGHQLDTDHPDLDRVWMTVWDTGNIQEVEVSWEIDDPQQAHSMAVELAEQFDATETGGIHRLDEWLADWQAGDHDASGSSGIDAEPRYSIGLGGREGDDRDLPRVTFRVIWSSAMPSDDPSP